MTKRQKTERKVVRTERNPDIVDLHRLHYGIMAQHGAFGLAGSTRSIYYRSQIRIRAPRPSRLQFVGMRSARRYGRKEIPEINRIFRRERPRLWRKKALIAALCALVLVTAALAVFLPHRPKTYEGGASVTYTDQDGTYELLVGTSLNNIEDKQPEEKRTLSLSVDETSYLPAMLGVYRNGTPVDPEAFLAKVERCILEAFPNENGALDIAEPGYNEMFSAAVLETDVVFTGASGTNELVWTLTMKNGDTIRLKHTFEVLPLVHAAFTAEDTPLNTIEDLKALLDRIDGEADAVVDIYLPPVTYTGDLHISSRAVNLYGCCDGSGRTVIEGSLTVSTHVPDKVVLHDLDFVGNGGNGLTATASTMIENCSFTGYDIGAAVENGGMIGVEACTFRNNKIGFSYDTLRYSFSKDGFPDCRIEGNDVGVQFVNLPGAMPLDFFGTVFSGNGTDIDNPIQNPIDLSNAIFE